MDARALRPLIAWIPNALSLARLALAVAFPFVAPPARPWVLVLGAFSDWLDGWVARQFHVKSISGAVLDAVADKLFVLSVLVTLAAHEEVGAWQVVAVMTRDVVVLILSVWVAILGEWSAFRHMPPHVPGKFATALVFAWAISLFTLWARPAQWPLFWLAVAASVAAAVDYVVLFVRALGARRRGESPARLARGREPRR